MTIAPSATTTRVYKRQDFILARNGWHGWGYAVTPCTPLREFLLHQFRNHTGPWREQFYFDIAGIMRYDQKTVSRRMRDVFLGQSKIVKAEYADAACLALGLHIDRDTTVPTLPGNLRLAEELVRLRSPELLTLPEARRLARKVIRLSALIVGYPHNQERLQDLAPFNCLRSGL